jgi:hypothetical protein
LGTSGLFAASLVQEKPCQPVATPGVRRLRFVKVGPGVPTEMRACGVSVASGAESLAEGPTEPVGEDDGEFEDDGAAWFDRSDISTPASATATTSTAAIASPDARRAGPRPNGKPNENRILNPLFSRVTSPAYSNTDPGTGG